MYYIIFNPTAGAGRSVKAMQRVEQHLKESGVTYEMATTQYARHSMELAAAAVGKGYDGILSVGGDGTLLEIAQVLKGTDETLGVIPAGTGNDFRQAIGVPRDPVEALRVALRGKKKRVDVGILDDDKVFLNVAGTGFDVEVIKYTEKVRRITTGGLAYYLGIVMSLFAYKHVNLTITANGKTIEAKSAADRDRQRPLLRRGPLGGAKGRRHRRALRHRDHQQRAQPPGPLRTAQDAARRARKDSGV